MNNKKILLASALAVGIVCAPAYAAKGANGRPFRELQTQIDSNRALIEANTSAISGLQYQVADINQRIDDLDSSIDDLTLQVNGNANEIVAVMEKVSTTENGIAGLRAELTALAQQHASELDAVNQALAGIDAELANLNDARQALAEDLNEKLAALSADVGENTMAIDTLVLQLVTVNAQLTSINSSIMDLDNRSNELQAAQTQYGAQLAELTELAEDLENAVDTLQGYHVFTFSGIQTDVPVASLNGWTECYKASYADTNAHPEAMMAACTGGRIMLACRPTGSNVLTVAAYANRDDVFHNTGDGNNVTHTANGVDWYFSTNYSMGFAPVGAGVLRNMADVKGLGDDTRLSWHTHNTYAAGYRCGANVDLNRSTGWEKIIYQAD